MDFFASSMILKLRNATIASGAYVSIVAEIRSAILREPPEGHYWDTLIHIVE